MSSTLSRIDGAPLPRLPGPKSRLRGAIENYYELTKPRIIYLLLLSLIHISKRTSPKRSQCTASSESAIAMRGPSGPNAVYAITYRSSAGMNVTRGSSQPIPPGVLRTSYGASGSSAKPVRSNRRSSPARIPRHVSTRETLPSATARG